MILNKKGRRKFKMIQLGIMVAIAVFILFIYTINHFSDSTILRQKMSLQNALERDIIQCYALEGFYPPSLSYIEENYGLLYDDSLFIVDYRPIGSNIYPDFTIIQKGVSAHESQNGK